MEYVIECIYEEILNWQCFHKYYLNCYHKLLDVHILQQLYWTTFGIVDYQKTAENLICLELLNLKESYILACLYCLDDYIPFLWEKLPENVKSYFYKDKGPITRRINQLRNTRQPLESCWPYILKGEETKLDMFDIPFRNITTFNQYAFEYFASIGNKAAAVYFFQKLTIVERETSLFRPIETLVKTLNVYLSTGGQFPPLRRIDTFCFLLSQMSSEKQIEIVMKSPCKVLDCFLNYPWKQIFSDVLDNIWTSLTAIYYVCLLNTICSRIGEKHLDHTKVFQKVFLRGSVDFRKHFVDQECQSVFCFGSFLRIQDFGSIKLIFRALDYVDRKKLVFSAHFFNLFYESIEIGGCDFLELCLKEATLSKADKMELEKTFHTFLTENNVSGARDYKSFIEMHENAWVQFLHVLYINKEAISKNENLYKLDMFKE